MKEMEEVNMYVACNMHEQHCVLVDNTKSFKEI